MSEQRLIGSRHLLFLDEAIKDGVEKESDRPDYPPLSSEERRVLKVIANGLYISESAIQWGYHNAQRGQRDAFRRILEILSAGRLKPLTRAR
jgi:hypothetical protein